MWVGIQPPRTPDSKPFPNKCASAGKGKGLQRVPVPASGISASPEGQRSRVRRRYCKAFRGWKAVYFSTHPSQPLLPRVNWKEEATSGWF